MLMPAKDVHHRVFALEGRVKRECKDSKVKGVIQELQDWMDLKVHSVDKGCKAPRETSVTLDPKDREATEVFQDLQDMSAFQVLTVFPV